MLPCTSFNFFPLPLLRRLTFVRRSFSLRSRDNHFDHSSFSYFPLLSPSGRDFRALSLISSNSFLLSLCIGISSCVLARRAPTGTSSNPHLPRLWAIYRSFFFFRLSPRCGKESSLFVPSFLFLFRCVPATLCRS